jgi:hemolysin activation/secretion protein
MPGTLVVARESPAIGVEKFGSFMWGMVDGGIFTRSFGRMKVIPGIGLLVGLMLLYPMGLSAQTVERKMSGHEAAHRGHALSTSPGHSGLPVGKSGTNGRAAGAQMAQGVQGKNVMDEVAPARTRSPEKEKPEKAARPLKPLVAEEDVYFTVVKFQVEGNSLLEEETIQEILRPFKGFAQQVKDMEQARLALEKSYHEAGYPTVLVVLPQQKIENGIIRLEVVESRVNTLTVSGNRFFSTDHVLSKMPSVRVGAILHEPTLRKELSGVNAHPDRNVTPILKPGEETGTVNLELKVDDRLPLHASVTGDNRGALNTPKNRIVAEVQYTNLWDLDHIVTFQTVQTPEELGEVQVYGMTYVAPLGDPRRLFSIYGSISDTSSSLAGTSLPVGGGGAVGIGGNSKIAGLRYSFPLDTDDGIKHLFSAGLDYIRLGKSSADFGGVLGTAVVSSPVEYLPLSLGYTGILGHHSGVSALNVGLKGYVAGVLPDGKKEDFAGDPNDPDTPGNRVGSTGTFGIIHGSLDRTQFLPSDFLLTAHIDGQWANEPLIAVEQLFSGGMDTVRGYLQNEALGDMGFRTRLELMTPTYSLNFDRPVNSWLKADLRFLTFFDTAFLWVRRPQPGQREEFQLNGAGIGLRANITEYLDLQVDHGWALRDGAISESGDSFTHFVVKMTL